MKITRKLRDIQFKAPIIFLTAHADYAVESYEVYAAGYLLKPYDTNKLTLLLDEVLQRSVQKRIAVKVKKQHRYLEINDIMYVESDKHTITLHLSDQSEIVAQDKLIEIEKRIDEKRFLHCHQSYLVNMDYIKDVKEDFELQDGTIIPIRVRGRKEVLDKYNEYFASHFE